MRGCASTGKDVDGGRPLDLEAEGAVEVVGGSVLCGHREPRALVARVAVGAKRAHEEKAAEPLPAVLRRHAEVADVGVAADDKRMDDSGGPPLGPSEHEREGGRVLPKLAAAEPAGKPPGGGGRGGRRDEAEGRGGL